MTDIHTPNEHIAVADLEAMVDVTLALVDAALEEADPRGSRAAYLVSLRPSSTSTTRRTRPASDAARVSTVARRSAQAV